MSSNDRLIANYEQSLRERDAGLEPDRARLAAVIESYENKRVATALVRTRVVLADPLTRRQLQVLLLIADGMTNREIGNVLYLSEETVKSHVRGVLAVLGAHSRAHAVAIAFHRGWIAPDVEQVP